jgi:XTP/dITP diphosphohydrolase
LINGKAEMTRPVLVLGTGNRKKLAELTDLLAPLQLELKSLADFPNALVVEETGDSFASNAALKATQQARHLGHWVLGEDSGLAVDALKGAPGIYSARYSDPGATDERNNQKLLIELANVPLEKRTAHYVCHATLSDPLGKIRAESEGWCRGRLRTGYAGSGGFGYDPLFEIVEYHRTFGELASPVKAMLSHRARAVRQLIPEMMSLIDQQLWTA